MSIIFKNKTGLNIGFDRARMWTQMKIVELEGVAWTRGYWKIYMWGFVFMYIIYPTKICRFWFPLLSSQHTWQDQGNFLSFYIQYEFSKHCRLYIYTPLSLKDQNLKGTQNKTQLSLAWELSFLLFVQWAETFPFLWIFNFVIQERNSSYGSSWTWYCWLPSNG